MEILFLGIAIIICLSFSGLVYYIVYKFKEDEEEQKNQGVKKWREELKNRTEKRNAKFLYHYYLVYDFSKVDNPRALLRRAGASYLEASWLEDNYFNSEFVREACYDENGILIKNTEYLYSLNQDGFQLIEKYYGKRAK